MDKNLKWIIAGIALFIIIVLTFTMGVLVGQERAQFSFRWAENYHRVFGGPPRGLLGNLPARSFINGHGLFGSVVSIDKSDIIVKDHDDEAEKDVVYSSQTSVVSPHGTVQVSDIKIGDIVVVIGSPDDQGRINATFIRILPPNTPSLRPSIVPLMPS